MTLYKISTLFPRTNVCSCVSFKKYCHFAQLLLQAIVHAWAFMPHWLVLCWFLVNWRKSGDNTQQNCAFPYINSRNYFFLRPSFPVILQTQSQSRLKVLLINERAACRQFCSVRHAGILIAIEGQMRGEIKSQFGQSRKIVFRTLSIKISVKIWQVHQVRPAVKTSVANSVQRAALSMARWKSDRVWNVKL